MQDESCGVQTSSTRANNGGVFHYTLSMAYSLFFLIILIKLLYHNFTCYFPYSILSYHYRLVNSIGSCFDERLVNDLLSEMTLLLLQQMSSLLMLSKPEVKYLPQHSPEWHFALQHCSVVHSMEVWRRYIILINCGFFDICRKK